jgi:hypothetical protein
MPRKPSKFIERGGGETLSEEQVQDLIFGRELLSGLTEAFPNEEARKKAFRKYESELLRRFVERYPGRRPPLWWEVSAPEPLQKIGESSTPFPLGPKKGFWKVSDVYEIEFSYLKRLGLLLENEEKKALASESVRIELESQAKVLQMHKDRLTTIPPERFVRDSLFRR